MATVAAVRLWGTQIGAVLLPDGADVAVFEYDPEFVRNGLQVSPLVMGLSAGPRTFPELSRESFYGLPGLLADSLPDKYGHALINAWLASQGRPPDSLGAVERLCYVGRRGMGALEFEPARRGRGLQANHELDIAALVDRASRVLTQRAELVTSLSEGHDEEAMRDILSVGTSAGGARAKAVIAWNPQSGAIRSGQLDAEPGFEHWLLKFDGIEGNRDKEQLADPRGYGAIEYAYSLMARQAGVQMMPCRLLEENGRRHFMTRRFDRDANGGKRHMQSLGALAHWDFNLAGAYSYEQALMAIRHGLHLPMAAVEQQFRRMVFNVVARNQDDPVKNIAFLMDQEGQWSLSPAFDVIWAFGPGWTHQHQMTINGKRDGITRQDLRNVAAAASMKSTRPEQILAEVREAVSQWPAFAEQAGVALDRVDAVGATHRSDLPA
jgi:serine/threonine-protein kinase HipA